MRLRHLLSIAFIALVFAGCTHNDHKFMITGDITGMPQQNIVLEQVNINDIITIVDSGRSTTDGHFELSGTAPAPGLYRLRFNSNKFILLSIERGNIQLSANWNKLDDYTVTGSPASENIKVLIGIFRQNATDFNSMKIVMDTLKARGNDSMLTVAKRNYEDMKQHFTLQVEAFADTSSFEANAIFAARILNAASEEPFLETFTASLSRRFPDNGKMTKDFVDYFNKVTVKQKQPAMRASTVDAGYMAPDFTCNTPDGHPVALHSFKGKYLLVDFWASWCGPCRGENPNVVAAYEKYKDKNFTILSVSLDNDKNAWLKAIKDDNLTWTQVSDLQGWSSPASLLYGIQSIPANFLVDPNGKIIARNLRGDGLELFLENVFKNAH